MKRFALLLAALIAGAALGQTTVTIPAQTVKVTVPVQILSVPSQTISITIPAQTVVIPSTPPVVVTPPVVTPPPVTPAGTYWVYHNGVFAWLGSYDYNGTSNTKDTSGVPMDGPFDISFTMTAAGGGGWQPFDIPSGATGTNLGFDVRPYSKLHFCIKPTRAGEQFGSGIAANNDTDDGNAIQVFAGPNTTKYGPVPTVGVWGCYTIPLADYALTNPLILKFGISTGTPPPDLFYIDDVAFLP